MRNLDQRSDPRDQGAYTLGDDLFIAIHGHRMEHPTVSEDVEMYLRSEGLSPSEMRLRGRPMSASGRRDSLLHLVVIGAVAVLFFMSVALM